MSNSTNKQSDYNGLLAQAKKLSKWSFHSINRTGGYLLFTLLPLAIISFITFQLFTRLNHPQLPIKKVGVQYGIQPVGTNLLIPEMVTVPSGSFEMGGSNGESDELPLHRVKVNSFEIGRFEITNAQWKAFCDAEKRESPPNPGFGKDYFITNPNFPVVNVSWLDAQDYCQWLSKVTGRQFRLPTEAEWEYAAQDSPMGRTNSNRSKTSPSTAQVGSYPANQFGISDMLGNVWEWCSDWYKPGYYKESSEDNPNGPSQGSQHVVRGGSWGDPAMMCRVSNRLFYFPQGRYKFYGLRVAADLSPNAAQKISQNQ